MFQNHLFVVFLHPRSFFCRSFTTRDLQQGKVLLSVFVLVWCTFAIVTYLPTSNKWIIKIFHILHGLHLFEQHLHHTPPLLAPPANLNKTFIPSHVFTTQLQLTWCLFCKLSGLPLKKKWSPADRHHYHHLPTKQENLSKTLVKITFQLCVSLHAGHLILAQVHKVTVNGPSKSLFRLQVWYVRTQWWQVPQQLIPAKQKAPKILSLLCTFLDGISYLQTVTVKWW